MAKRIRLKALIMDFDGTIVQLPTDYPSVRRDLRSYFGALGYWSDFKPILGNLDRLRRLIGRNLGEPRARRIVEEARKIILRHELDAISLIKPCPGAIELLETARRDGVPIAVVTNNARQTVEAAFGSLGLPAPAVIVGIGDTTKSKPSPEPALLALVRLHVNAREAIVVGDDDRDIKMAKAARILAVLVKTRNRTRRFPTLSDLRKALEQGSR